MDRYRTYGKACMAVLFALLLAGLHAASGEGALGERVSGEEAFQIVTAGGVAVGVWLVPMFPGVAWPKTALALVMTGVGAAGSVVLDGVSSHDVLFIAVEVLTVLGVASAPAVSTVRAVRSVSATPGDR